MKLASPRKLGIGLVIGVVAAGGLAAGWIHLSAAFEKPGAKVAAALPKTEPAASVPAFDPADSMLGSDSSISTEPLQLTLVATMPGQTPRLGTAMLGTNPRNPQTYAAGARLVNGAVIDEIHADHIVLSRDGKRSKLHVGESGIGARLVEFAGGSNQATTVGGSDAVKAPLDTVATSREDLSEIIRPEPVFDDRGFVGLRILAGRNRGKLESLGLQQGDVVRTIEGKQPKDADSAWQLLDDVISTGSSIVITIEREGTLASVILDGSRITEQATQVNSFGATGPMPPGAGM